MVAIFSYQQLIVWPETFNPLLARLLLFPSGLWKQFNLSLYLLILL